MSSTTVLPVNVVHEAIDERQFVRAKIPARITLNGHGLKGVECEILDISLGGIGLSFEQPLKIGSLFHGSIKLKLNTVDLNIDTKLKIVSQRGHEVGAEFVELDRQKRDILRYIISAYMSGDIADINGLFNVMQRENYIKERKTKQASSRTPTERLKAALGSMLFLGAGLAALSLIAYKSYLLFFPYDNSEMYPFADQPAGDTLWELGLDFTVSPTKGDFRGASEHRRLQGKERFRIFGVLLDGDKAAEAGDTLWADGKQVGVITCAMYSRLSGKSMAIARMDVPYAEQGVPLQVKGSLAVNAIAHTLPFDDPEKKKRTAKG